MNKLLTEASLADFHMRLHAWYAQQGRHDLPWRNTRDPYAIYVSEIMLQQTQVETVRSRFYTPFLARFPTVADLARAERQEVLKAWEGLGYYTRAANLHEAAKKASPSLPSTVDELIALPGIGRNTAHAVAAFAYHVPVPVMEANVRRVLHRIFALQTAPEALLWEKAEVLLDHAHPFDYNQAMMDIGSMVCTKRKPACMLCPAHAICLGKSSPESYPAVKAAKKTPVRSKNIIILQDQDKRIYAQPRTSRFLNGLYHFIEIDRDANAFSFEGKSYLINDALKLGQITQVYSHFTLEADVHLYTLTGKVKDANWHAPAKLSSLPWSQAEQKILKLVISQSKN